MAKRFGRPSLHYRYEPDRRQVRGGTASVSGPETAPQSRCPGQPAPFEKPPPGPDVTLLALA
jgi:hypothetical protein